MKYKILYKSFIFFWKVLGMICIFRKISYAKFGLKRQKLNKINRKRRYIPQLIDVFIFSTSCRFAPKSLESFDGFFIKIKKMREYLF